MLMRLTTSLLPTTTPDSNGIHSDIGVVSDTVAAVVIDVLRATSVMTTALQNGATSVITCREVEEARRLSQAMIPPPLLCGERGCKPIDGFDLGNSPAEYTGDRVRKRTLVLTTTNGTRAIAAVERMDQVLIGSFLNLSAVVDRLRDYQHVHLVCAGTEGQVTLEDVLLAGALVWRCQTTHGGEPGDDDSVLALQLWRSWFPNEAVQDCMPSAGDLSRRFRETRGGRNLLKLGLDADLERCARIDSLSVVPRRIEKSPATFATDTS
jgi:2-phosphosulfolactate phosphatase